MAASRPSKSKIPRPPRSKGGTPVRVIRRAVRKVNNAARKSARRTSQ